MEPIDIASTKVEGVYVSNGSTVGLVSQGREIARLAAEEKNQATRLETSQ